MALLLSTAAAAVVPSAFEPNISHAANMNGEYILSETPSGHQTQKNFPRRFSEYPRGVEMFEVVSDPITTRYSQVWWKEFDPTPLPPEVVRRYAGRGMAVVGFEVDQVRVLAGGAEVRVPINAAYNHHVPSCGTNARILQRCHACRCRVV